MDDLAFLRDRIKPYADYTKEADRQLSDDQIRAYAGESLARFEERLQPAGAVGEALARVVLRCQFADQRVARALETQPLSDGLKAALHAVDREIVTLADQTDRIDVAGAQTWIAEIDAAFDRKLQLVLTAGPAGPVPPIVVEPTSLTN